MQYLNIMDYKHAKKEVVMLDNDVPVSNFEDIDNLLRYAGFDPRYCYSMLTRIPVVDTLREEVVHVRKSNTGEDLKPVGEPNDGYSYYI